jgi:hypothetical protein
VNKGITLGQLDARRRPSGFFEEVVARFGEAPEPGVIEAVSAARELIAGIERRSKGSLSESERYSPTEPTALNQTLGDRCRWRSRRNRGDWSPPGPAVSGNVHPERQPVGACEQGSLTIAA